MTRVTLYFPPQETKANYISKQIRQNTLFKPFVVSKSRDFRYLTLDFKEGEKYKILKPLIFQVLKTLNYDVEEFTE